MIMRNYSTDCITVLVLTRCWAGLEPFPGAQMKMTVTGDWLGVTRDGGTGQVWHMDMDPDPESDTVYK